jgi:hypothetical protein
MEPYLWKTRPDGINVINIGKTWEKIVLAARIIVAIDNPADSTFNPTPEFDILSSGRILHHIANSSQSVSFLPALTDSVPSSSSPPTLVPLPLPVASPPVTSPITSPVRSRSPVSSSSPTRALTPRPSRRPHTSTFPLLCVYNPCPAEYRANIGRPSSTPTPPPSTSMLPSPPTTRVVTPSVSSGGCLPVRSSVSAEPSPTARPSGTS